MDTITITVLVKALTECESVLDANFADTYTIEGRRAMAAVNSARLALAIAGNTPDAIREAWINRLMNELERS